jgi:hypothetical protein
VRQLKVLQQAVFPVSYSPNFYQDALSDANKDFVHLGTCCAAAALRGAARRDAWLRSRPILAGFLNGTLIGAVCARQEKFSAKELE